MRKAVLSGVLAIASVCGLVLVLGASAGSAAEGTGRTRVAGELVLASRTRWTSNGRSCVGTGLYGDVRRGMRIVVRDVDGVALARTSLGRGKRLDAACSFAFRVVFPHASFYTFEVGYRGEVFQESYDNSAFRLKRHRLTFTIP